MAASERSRRPTHISYALAALAAAWLMSTIALFVNQVVLEGSGIGPGPILGIASLGVQIAAIWLVAHRNKVGRVLVGFFFALSALPLPIVARLVAEGSHYAAAYTVLSFALKGIASVLLFADNSRAWFRGEASPI